MADYQLTQTGNEVQALLNDIPKGKFTWLTSVNTSLYDEIPQAQAEWFMGWYDPSWTNRPCDYGLIFRTTPNSAFVPLSAEIAIGVGAEKGEIYVRTTENGDPWTQWRSLQPALTYTTYVNMLDIIPANPTSATTASYTVPNNGWVYMYATRGSTAGNSLFLSVNGVTCYTFPAYDAYAVVGIIFPVTRGQTLKFTTDSASATWTIRQLHFSR